MPSMAKAPQRHSHCHRDGEMFMLTTQPGFPIPSLRSLMLKHCDNNDIEGSQRLGS